MHSYNYIYALYFQKKITEEDLIKKNTFFYKNKDNATITLQVVFQMSVHSLPLSHVIGRSLFVYLRRPDEMSVKYHYRCGVCSETTSNKISMVGKFNMLDSSQPPLVVLSGPITRNQQCWVCASQIIILFLSTFWLLEFFLKHSCSQLFSISLFSSSPSYYLRHLDLSMQ